MADKVRMVVVGSAAVKKMNREKTVYLASLPTYQHTYSLFRVAEELLVQPLHAVAESGSMWTSCEKDGRDGKHMIVDLVVLCLINLNDTFG